MCQIIGWLIGLSFTMIDLSINHFWEKNCWLLRSCTSGCAKASTEPRRGPPIIIWLVTISSHVNHLYNALLIRLVECSVYLKTDSFAKIWFVAADEFKNGVCALHMFLRRAMSKQVLNDGWTNLAGAKMVHKKMTVMISKCFHHLKLNVEVEVPDKN